MFSVTPKAVSEIKRLLAEDDFDKRVSSGENRARGLLRVFLRDGI